MRQKLKILVVLVVIIIASFTLINSSNPVNKIFAANKEVFAKSGKNNYVIAISRQVFEQNPEIIEILNSTWFLEDNSIKKFFLKNSYGKFVLGATIFVVEQDYPNMFSVIADLDDVVDWTKIKGVFMFDVNDCSFVSSAGALPPQEFQTNDGPVLLTGVIMTKCAALSSGLKQTLKHELAHTLNLNGHANLLESSAYYRQRKYTGCRLPFNSRSPDVRAFNAADNCPVSEYGDFLDVLGSSGDESVTIFSASRKELAGWLPKILPTTREIKNKGNYNVSLYPHDTIQDNSKYLLHVKIMKGQYGFYSIEFRENLGAYAKQNQVMIRYAFNVGGTTYLIASLSPGETYNNPVDKFSVKFRFQSSKRKFKPAELKIILK